MTKPPKSILDPSFAYKPSHLTDITETWEKAKKRMEEERARRDAIVRDLKPLGRKDRNA